jgi:hypothetical protein
MATNPYSRGASNTATSTEDPEHIILPPIHSTVHYGESSRARSPATVLPALNSPAPYSEEFYQMNAARAHQTSLGAARRYADLSTSPYEFMAGNKSVGEPRQYRRIGQRRDTPTIHKHRVDRKPEPTDIARHRPADSNNRSSLRGSPPFTSSSREREHLPDRGVSTADTLEIDENYDRELRKRRSSGAIAQPPKRHESSMLPISDLISNDSR